MTDKLDCPLLHVVSLFVFFITHVCVYIGNIMHISCRLQLNLVLCIWSYWYFVVVGVCVVCVCVFVCVPSNHSF